MTSHAIEDYLKAIYELKQHSVMVSTNSLASGLKIRPASVTGMVKKMAEMGLLNYRSYRGVSLTDHGLMQASAIIRRHRLSELYMVRMLGIPWDQVHDEAEKWEHVLSDDVESRFDELLGNPNACPHGSPIPLKGEILKFIDDTPLTGMKQGESAVVLKVDDRNAEMLRYFGELGLYPGVRFRVDSVAPGNSLIKVMTENAEFSLGYDAAKMIFVADIKR